MRIAGLAGKGAYHSAVTMAASVLLATTLSAPAAAQQPAADGLYAAIYTTKGRILARLEMDLTPMTVANFVGLAEGTLANAAFDPGRPFYDGTTWHRVVAGHVIQGGAAASERARAPGYTFPNEIHSRLSHNHAGALNMANGGPHTNSSQFCVTLGDRSYLDGDYTVFGEVLEGMNVVMSIVQGDGVDSVRILRVGARAAAFRPTTASFQSMVESAKARVVADDDRKRQAEQAWIREHWPNAQPEEAGVLTQRLAEGRGAASGQKRVRYRGQALRYMAHRIGYVGPALEVALFVSGEDGRPGLHDSAAAFTFEPGVTRLVPGLDRVLAGMSRGEKRLVILPAEQAYGRNGLYTTEVPGRRRFVISPNTMLVFEVEVLPQE